MGHTQPSQELNNPVKLSVVHGHLAFARFPVLVGHYIGDAFTGTEARLDRALRFRLTERRKLGLYPGEIGTCAVLTDPDVRPFGAVIVGLGQPASLSMGGLRDTIRRGILAFVVDTLDRTPAKAHSASLPIGLSALLIGAGIGGVDRASCVRALLQATSQANAVLAKLERPGALLEAVEIIELYEDRAYETWRAVKKSLENDPVLGGVFGDGPTFISRKGGRHHAPIARDPRWWEPIQITMSPGERAEDRSLSFTVGGGFARTDARTIAANLDIVAPLMRRTAQNVDIDGAPISPGRILFELLWPESLKHRSSEEQNRRLILDEQSARFPWELLDDRRPWTSTEDVGAPKLAPPAVRAGLVRQLLQTRSSDRIAATSGRPKALLIGDPGAVPMKGFGALPGAEAEAKAIDDLLRARQSHDVRLLIKAAATPNQIFKELLGQAWEIVHICAHGVVDFDMPTADGANRKVTGVILGDGVVLGPSELSKLPVSPAIFFVNCCNLGKIDAVAEENARKEGLDGRPELAASVAVQLIQLGVRCVIVAGWEVDDDCAKAFGLRFYSEMLDGANFGDATMRARKAAYETKPDNNTWGAFQCYGNPDYRLRIVSRPPTVVDTANQFVGISEAIAAAEQISEDLNVGLERDLAFQREKLVSIAAEAERKGWLACAQMCVSLAEAWAELGSLQAAIEYYSAAIKNEEASFKLKAVEQLANLRSRQAVIEFRQSPEGKRDPNTAIVTIKDALTKLSLLIDAVGPTPERYALQAGCWKRLAQVQPLAPDGNDALVRMKDCAEMAIAFGGDDVDYPLLIASTAALCIGLRNGTRCDRAVANELQRMATEPAPDEPDFWTIIRPADARINLAILNMAQDDMSAIKNVYRDAWRYNGSPVKMRSVAEQLEFFEDILTGGVEKSGPDRQQIKSWIAELRQFIESEFLST